MISEREFNPAIADCRLQGTANSPSSTAKNSGAERARTADLYVANVPLSQLSYCPIPVHIRFAAERAGFEPAVAFTTHAFQACTFNHSVTSPIHLPKLSRSYAKFMPCGEGGIRTHGPAMAGQRFSRPPDSTALAPLRITYWSHDCSLTPGISTSRPLIVERTK